MQQGSQGWWTAGKYDPKVKEFIHITDFTIIMKDYKHWGFQKKPFENTCVWILQEKAYAHALGNEDCSVESGFVCEINLPT